MKEREGLKSEDFVFGVLGDFGEAGEASKATGRGISLLSILQNGFDSPEKQTSQ